MSVVIATLSAAILAADKKIKMFSDRLEACKPEQEETAKVFNEGKAAIEALGDALPNGTAVLDMLASGHTAQGAALKLKMKKLETEIGERTAERAKLVEELAKHQPPPPAPAPEQLGVRVFGLLRRNLLGAV